VLNQMSVPFYSEGADRMTEAMKPEKQFKTGRLVTKEAYEAAISVICQAIANGQYGSRSYTHDDCEASADSAYRSYKRSFREPAEILKETESNLRRHQEELEEAKSRVEAARARIAEIGAAPTTPTVKPSALF